MTDKAPHWAVGCPHCRFGIRRQPQSDQIPAALYLVRILQCGRGHIEFCDCPAGRSYRRFVSQRAGELGQLTAAEVRTINEWLDENPPLPTVHT